MPHVNSSGGDDLASTDEVKVYKDEGEEEKRSSENLSEDKLGLVTESEEGKSSDIEGRSYSADDKGSTSGQDGKPPEPPGIDRRLGPLGYPIISPYPYHNGASMLGSKILPPPHPSALASLYMYNNEHFSQPPPAHMGIPPVNIDPKTESPLSIIYSSAFSSHKGYDPADLAGNLALRKCVGLPRPSMYGLPPTSQLSHPFCPPDFAQFTWGPPPGYPLAAFRSPYGPPLSSSPLPRFSPPGIMPPHPGFPSLQHPAIITPGPKQEVLPISSSDNNRHHPSQFQLLEGGGGLHGGSMTPPHMEEKEKKCKKPHIKKPLNAFMLFMKEMRAKVIEECTLKESAAINQILGRKWHALDRAEQSKYYDMARKEKELHMQLYPGWSARDNYALHSKKKKRKREPHAPDNRGAATAVDNVHWRAMENCSTEQKYKHDDICAQDCANAKKCRARFGLDQQNQWCKPCRSVTESQLNGAMAASASPCAFVVTTAADNHHSVAPSAVVQSVDAHAPGLLSAVPSSMGGTACTPGSGTPSAAVAAGL
ncbi:Protein pangolin [Lamellibrachia satsuma]|nr:Protein pangolin [Lamellibrachia satsuma]